MPKRLTTKHHYILEPNGPNVVEGVRKDIVDYLSENPGSYYSEIKRGIGINNGSLNHHLRVLERRGVIKSERGSAVTHYSLVNGFNAEKEVRTMDQEIVGVLSYENGLQSSEVARKLGISSNAAFSHLKRLEQDGMVEHLRDGYFRMPKADELYKSSKGISLKATAGCRLQLAEM